MRHVAALIGQLAVGSVDRLSGLSVHLLTGPLPYRGHSRVKTKAESRDGAGEGGDRVAFATLKRFSQAKANLRQKWRRK